MYFEMGADLRSEAKQILVAYLCGGLFATGLGISGMTQPQKILSFLNVIGPWSPALLFVMGSAVLINAFVYFFIVRGLKAPLLAAKWTIPKGTPITASLIVGSILFGIGWGIAGYCPGPAFVSVVSLQRSTVIFVSSMFAGMLLFKFYSSFRTKDGQE